MQYNPSHILSNNKMMKNYFHVLNIPTKTMCFFSILVNYHCFQIYLNNASLHPTLSRIQSKLYTLVFLYIIFVS